MRSESRSLRSFSAFCKIARPEGERSWPRLALAIGLSLLAAAIFLLVASNVLLIGLRAHDGGLHLFDILTLAPQFGVDKRLDRWLTIGFIAGAVTTFALLGMILRARPRPLHGAARFATPHDIKAAGLRAKNGLLLAQVNGKLLTFGGTEHVIVYAPTRSGKGVGVVIPNLLSWSDSVVVLDVKKENFIKTAGFRGAHGQKVYLFDPVDPEGRTARYNPLSCVRRDPADLYDDLQRIAGMLFPPEPRGDPFWTEAARSAFIAIGGYIAETPQLPFTIGEILRQLTAAADVKAHFERVLSGRKDGPDQLSASCVAALNDFLAASENTLQSVRKTVTARLGLWLNPRIDAATSASDFNLSKLRSEAISIYLAVTPDNLDRLAPLLNLFFQQVVDLNARELPQHNPAHSRQLLLLLDEFPSLGHVGVLAKSVAFIAGYGVRLLTVLQSPSQLRAIYGADEAKNFLTNHAIEIVFTPKEHDVAVELSERFGTQTVEAKSRSRPWGFSNRSRSETISDHRRPLLLPQELKLTPKAKAFVLMAGVPPILADKLVYYEDRRFTDRLLPPPIIEPMPAPTHEALASQVLQLQQDVAELRAIVIRRPLTDAEIDDPASIPADALTNLGDVPLDLENVSEGALNDWVAGYIDGAARYNANSEATEASVNSSASQPLESEDARAKGAAGRGQRRKRSLEMSRG
ncbi:type IV secretory system conjugative DNA transfer family protein [Methylocystis sp. B8]|uniref:type IV secretory system conjugative DNA transfer family protein n=1 Tax=Methylocystis sp. B8 TaxID=544938 RepID=UPI0010FF5BF2|nr:type IV secretory system conjugative DNA transfer family protein [Methylocystis sp. B8]TLG72606.1 type IV secretory system conjugative DNA transfer family protein [Methylocystis sp. B8]